MAPEPEVEEDKEDADAELRARLVRFYEKYQPSKLCDVPKLVEKARGKEEELFGMLIKKYGPEPSVGDDDADDGDEEEEPEEDEYGLGLPSVVYCPADGLPPEYCEYGPAFEEALPWLTKHRPNLVLATKQGVTVSEYALARAAGDLSLDQAVKKNKRGKGIKGKKGKEEEGHRESDH